MPVEIGSSFEPLRFYSCFKSIIKVSDFRVDVLNTSNTGHRIFISKTETKMKRAKEIKTFLTSLGLQPLPDSHHILPK